MQTTVYVELHSGFGNQIFQYAFALSLRELYGFKVFILPSEGNSHSKTNYQHLFRLVDKAGFEDVPKNAIALSKKNAAFDWWNPLSLNINPVTRLSGYHQNYQLSRTVIPQIYNSLATVFQFIYGVPKEWYPYATAFLHVRRGDYLLPYIKVHILTMKYYKTAVEYVESKNPSVKKWLVVTDDEKWCKEQKFFQDQRFQLYGNLDELETFWAMSQCKAGAVIANSTYSYWGAMCGAHLHETPVVYPNAWHLNRKDPDLFPEDWIRIDD